MCFKHFKTGDFESNAKCNINKKMKNLQIMNGRTSRICLYQLPTSNSPLPSSYFQLLNPIYTVLQHL